MTQCVDEGRLRAFLDSELASAEHAAVAAHIASCPTCQAQAQRQRALAAQLSALLPPPAEMPDPRLALARLNKSIPTAPVPADDRYAHKAPTPRQRLETRMTMRNVWSSRRRSVLAAVAAAIAIVCLLALPPLRAAADELLSIFRVQRVVFLPIDPARMQQLSQLNFDKDTLFITKPTIDQPAKPRTVASAAEASSAVGYTVEQPHVFPSAPLSSQFQVSDPSKMHFQINAASARQLLQLMNIDDVTIPESLGARPIQVALPAFALIRYHGQNYDMTLQQGHSPDVTLPEGVDLRQLGKAALRLLGMAPEQAEATSQAINWNNTLIFPFPRDTNNIREVTINGESGLLVGGGARSQQHWQLYWQRGDKLYMLQASGTIRDTDMVAQLIATAESVN